MARHVVLKGRNGALHLQEVLADNEAQLQEQMKLHPELLPIEEWGLEGPLMVVGRETSLPSGAADLLGLARGGDVVIVEFKTGPTNSDFRHTLAQLLDYGAQLWQMEPDEFETTVARRYFASHHCPADATTKDATSVTTAAQRTWEDLTDAELTRFTERWRRALSTGSFHYAVVAQRFASTMERTIRYVNHQAGSARFHAVELVRFRGAGFDAFEGRTVLTPRQARTGGPSGSTDEQALLDTIGNEDYRTVVHRLLEFCRGQGLTLEWGSAGVSLRAPVPGSNQVVSIGWLYPPGAAGWLGLRGLSLGYDIGTSRKKLGDLTALDVYVAEVGRLAGTEPVEAAALRGHRIPPSTLVTEFPAVTEAIARLVTVLNSQA